MSKVSKVAISEQLELAFRPGSSLARLAQVSPHQLYREIEQAVAAARSRTSPLGDWIERFLDCSSPSACADAEALFVSYFSYCVAAGVCEDDRLTFSAFGDAMAERGHNLEPGSGRAVRRGCRLLRRGLMQCVIDPAPPIDQFLAECCDAERGVRARVRSTVLHEAYSAWAAEQGAAPLSIKRLGDALRYRGFDKLHSDGIYWIGLSLLSSSGADSSSPRPRRVKTGISAEESTGGRAGTRRKKRSVKP